MNLIYPVKVSFADYILGSEITVDRFGCIFKLKHDNNGDAVRRYRLKGKGILVNAALTDLIVEVSPKLPVTLNKKEVELVKKLSATEAFSEQPQTL
jgi:DnaJ-class molecular chaperone